jgi:AraC-like DNA-binding protein
VIERRVACFPPQHASLPRLRAALGSLTGLEAFGDVSALIEQIRAGSISATVVFVDHKTIAAAELELRRIRANCPAHPIIAYYHPFGLTPRHLFTVAQSGITELVQYEIDDMRVTFGRILTAALRVTYARTIVELLGDSLKGELRSVVLYALENAGRRMDVVEMAASLGISKRTLAWRLAQLDAPSPRVLISWCRLLVAALLLNDRGRTLDSVAGQLNYTDGHALGATLFRYLDRGIEALRDEGVLNEVLGAFKRALAGDGGDHDGPASLPARIRRS